MKTIFRLFNLAVLMAALAVAGTISVMAQDACTDTAGQETLSNKVRELYAKTDIPNLTTLIEAAKQYTEKYGACTSDSVKEFMVYLGPNLPKWEKKLADAKDKVEKDRLITKFNTALKAKNWDDLYAAGKDLITKWPDEFRPVELTLGSIGLDETAKTPPVTKWNEDTLKYARMSISDLESGKTFSAFGVKPIDYKNKEQALAWMNYTIGYILATDKNNKKDAVGYLYKATQLAPTDTGANAAIYDAIGLYYFDELKKQLAAVQEKIKAQDEKDPDDVKKQKVDEIKAAIAQLNGTAERALDVYARAYKYAPAANKAYKDNVYKTLQDIYKIRFEKLDGLDAYIAAAPSKPLPNPTTPIAPVSDPEPAAAGNTSGAAATVSPAPGKPGVTTVPGSAKPGATTTTKPDAAVPAKPAAKPAAKPQAVVRKATAKRRGV
jgi:hypothetical protein